MLRLSMLIILAVVLTVSLVEGQGQSKCDTVCANDPSCSVGKCILTQCTDSNSCFKYCLNCNGVETCYASGHACERAYNVVVLGSSSTKSSILIALGAILACTFLLFYSAK